MIRFGGIRAATGYFSASIPRAGPGIILLSDALGITPSLRAFADRLTEEERLTVLAPDLAVAGDDLPAASRSDDLPSRRLTAVLRDAAEHIALNWHPRVGAVGFSSGAAAAMFAAATLPVEAAVVYYGYAEVDPRGFTAPLLGHFGGRDDRVAADAAAAVFERFARAEFSLYDDAPHFFANPQVPGAFRQEEAEAAWNSTLDFLRYYLS